MDKLKRVCEILDYLCVVMLAGAGISWGLEGAVWPAVLVCLLLGQAWAIIQGQRNFEQMKQLAEEALELAGRIHEDYLQKR